MQSELLKINLSYDYLFIILDTTETQLRWPSTLTSQSKDPLLVADFNCQYRVVWETEHACRETDITSKTCKLVRPEDDINIDLTPLRHQRGNIIYW